MFKRPKRLKLVLCTVSEKENVYSVYFPVFNQNIEINRKLLKSDFWCKIIYFFRKRHGFHLKVVSLRNPLKKGHLWGFREK